MREDKTEVLVVGAGPVGLLTAVILADSGINVRIIDREERTATRSYACALHPRTLELLQRVGVMETLLEQGRQIPTVAFYDGEIRRAELDFAGLSGDFPFLLILPQSALEKALEQRLYQAGRLSVHWNYRFDHLQADQDEVLAMIERLGGTATGYIVPHWETVVMKRFGIRTQFVVGADGQNSLVRRRLGIEYERLSGPQSFAVVEFSSDREAENELRIVLDDSTTNVLWPLPRKKQRWTIQLTHSEAPHEFPEKLRETSYPGGADEDIRRWLQSVTFRRAPWFLSGIKEIAWCTQVAFEHRLAEEFGRGRCWLVGDAAHQTGPAGVQSMNLGLCEAELLAAKIRSILREDAPLDVLDHYNQASQAEWRQLFGLDSVPSVGPETNPWVRNRWDRLLPCIPASDGDLALLLGQLSVKPVQRRNDLAPTHNEQCQNGTL